MMRVSTVRRLAATAALLLGFGAIVVAAPAQAASLVPISGAGSTWSQNAIDQWARNVDRSGIRVNYGGTGSSDGRRQFGQGTTDFGVSEIPYGLVDSSNGQAEPAPNRKFAYMPIVAGGTAFMYNLKLGGRQVTNLRLSGEVIAKIFTGAITDWSDPAIAADNPGLALPSTRVVPVVRSDGSGTTAQFTAWLADQYPDIWNAFCAARGLRTPCGQTSTYPTGFIGQSGSVGVAGYVKQAQSEGAITYVEYSYALSNDFPVAKVRNAADFYVEPTANAVAVALLEAQINDDEGSVNYLTQRLQGVYANPDPRSYPLSSYSYMIVPTALDSRYAFSEDKGFTLASFAYYFLCEGQQQADVLGYSPLPINLVRAGFDQVRKIPGANLESVNLASCNNPTFNGSDETNVLAQKAPQPQACDRVGTTQCATGTGGAQADTPVDTSAVGDGGGGGDGGGDGGGGDGGGAEGGAGSGGGSSGGAAPGGAGSSGAAAGEGGALGAAADPSAVGDGGAVDDGTGSYVDPLTGELVTGGDPGGGGSGAGGATGLAATTVAAPPRGTWSSQAFVMFAAAVALLAATLVPPILGRRLARGPR